MCRPPPRHTERTRIQPRHTEHTRIQLRHTECACYFVGVKSAAAVEKKSFRENLNRGAGGTDGGVGRFVVGLVLSALDAY